MAIVTSWPNGLTVHWRELCEPCRNCWCLGVWIGFIWLRIGTSGGLFWTQ
jgi:hypothetical protein